MFIAALFSVVKTWKQPKCPLINKENMITWYVYSYKTESYSSTKNNEILQFVTTWVKLKCIMLREIGQAEEDKYHIILGFPGGSAGNESACNARDLGSIPGLGRSPGERKGYPLQYSGLENSMDCMVHGVILFYFKLKQMYVYKKTNKILS